MGAPHAGFCVILTCPFILWQLSYILTPKDTPGSSNSFPDIAPKPAMSLNTSDSL